MNNCPALERDPIDPIADDVHAAFMHLMRAKSQLQPWDAKYTAINIACDRVADAYQIFIEELLK